MSFLSNSNTITFLPAHDKNEFLNTRLEEIRCYRMHNSDLVVCKCLICATAPTCPICQDHFDHEQHRGISLKGCKHVFGRSCVINLVNSVTETRNKCPLCRDELFTLTTEERREATRQRLMQEAEVEDRDTDVEFDDRDLYSGAEWHLMHDSPRSAQRRRPANYGVVVRQVDPVSGLETGEISHVRVPRYPRAARHSFVSRPVAVRNGPPGARGSSTSANDTRPPPGETPVKTPTVLMRFNGPDFNATRGTRGSFGTNTSDQPRNTSSRPTTQPRILRDIVRDIGELGRSAGEGAGIDGAEMRLQDVATRLQALHGELEATIGLG